MKRYLVYRQPFINGNFRPHGRGHKAKRVIIETAQPSISRVKCSCGVWSRTQCLAQPRKGVVRSPHHSSILL